MATRQLVFVNGLNADDSIEMNSEVCRVILPAHIQLNSAKLLVQFSVQ